MFFEQCLNLSFYSKIIKNRHDHSQWHPSSGIVPPTKDYLECTLSAMSLSEVPSTCNDDFKNNLLSDSSSSSFTRSLSQSFSSSQPQQNARKRPFKFSKINLSNVTSSPVANGTGKPGEPNTSESGSQFGSQDSLNSANGISDDDNCDSPLDDANEKRLRLNSQSQSLSQFSSSSGYAYDQIAEMESSQGSASVKNPIPSGNGKRVGPYDLIGSGKIVQAVHVESKTFKQCQILKPEEFKTFLLLNERIKRAEAIYHRDEFKQLKELIIPDGTIHMAGDCGMWYIIMPDHYGSLHTQVQSRRAVYTERQAQPIFKQIVELVEFCHHIGIYLRDFKLKKFVYTDANKTKIRLNSLTDLYVSPKLDGDSLSDRCVCPAYVAPEILDMKKKTYAAKPADIWGLGVLLFILLTGHYPFFDADPRAFFRRIKFRRFSYPLGGSVSYPARWLLYGLLRQNPSDRPSAAELLHSLWLRTDAESLPDDVRETKSQPITSINSQGQNFPILTSSSSQPSLATSTPMMRLFLATPITAETSLGARVLLTPDIASDIDQTVPSMVPMTAPVIVKGSAEDSLRVDNPFLATIVSNASMSDSQAHLSSHI